MASIQTPITDLDDLLITLDSTAGALLSDETGLTVDTVQAQGTFTVTAGGTGDLRTNFRVGNQVVIAGTANSNGTFTIVAVAQTVLTVAENIGADETSGALAVSFSQPSTKNAYFSDYEITANSLATDAHGVGLTEPLTVANVDESVGTVATNVLTDGNLNFTNLGFDVGDIVTFTNQQNANVRTSVAAVGTTTITFATGDITDGGNGRYLLIKSQFITISGTTNYNGRFYLRDVTDADTLVLSSGATNTATATDTGGAIIEDGDDGVFETPEIIIDAPNKTIQLLNAGNLATLGSGVAGQALYSFFKERWKEVPGLTRFDFPMLSITNEQFEFQNGYRLADETTRKLIRTAGWVERSADNQSILQEYSGIITLGSLGLTDQPYFVQEGSSSASTTNTSFTGPVNEAVKIGATGDYTDLTFTTPDTIATAGGSFSDFAVGEFITITGSGSNNKTFLISDITNGNTITVDDTAPRSNAVVNEGTADASGKIAVNNRFNFKIFVRERAKSYGDADLNDIGVSEMTYIVYRFPVSNADDLNINTTDDNALFGAPVSDASGDGTDHTYNSLSKAFTDAIVDSAGTTISSTIGGLDEFSVGQTLFVSADDETSSNVGQKFIVATIPDTNNLTLSGNTLDASVAGNMTLQGLHGLYAGAPVYITGFVTNTGFNKDGQTVKEVVSPTQFKVEASTLNGTTEGTAGTALATASLDYIDAMELYYFEDIYRSFGHPDSSVTGDLNIIGSWNNGGQGNFSAGDLGEVVVDFSAADNTITSTTDITRFGAGYKIAVKNAVDAANNKTYTVNSAVTGSGDYILTVSNADTEGVAADETGDTVEIKFYYDQFDVVQDNEPTELANKIWFRASDAGESDTNPTTEISAGTDSGAGSAIVWEYYQVRGGGEPTDASNALATPVSNFGGGAEVESNTFSAYTTLIDANNASLTSPAGTKEAVYEWAQWLLRKTQFIESDTTGATAPSKTRIGQIADVLCTFVGSNLNVSTGVFVDNISDADANLITFFDYDGVQHVFPTVVGVTINFNENLTNDGDAVFYAYYTTLPSGNNFGTNDAVQVNRSDNQKVGADLGTPNNVPNGGQYQFNYSYTTDDADGTRPTGGSAANQNITVVSIGLVTGQYVKASADITTAGATISLVAPLERNYTNPT
jgi:hypothetical protein